MATGVATRESVGEKYTAVAGVGVDEPLLVAAVSGPRERLAGVGVSCARAWRRGEVDVERTSTLEVDSEMGRASADMLTPPGPV